jgi:hypothetical protein
MEKRKWLDELMKQRAVALAKGVLKKGEIERIDKAIDEMFKKERELKDKEGDSKHEQE